MDYGLKRSTWISYLKQSMYNLITRVHNSSIISLRNQYFHTLASLSPFTISTCSCTTLIESNGSCSGSPASAWVGIYLENRTTFYECPLRWPPSFEGKVATVPSLVFLLTVPLSDCGFLRLIDLNAQSSISEASYSQQQSAIQNYNVHINCNSNETIKRKNIPNWSVIFLTFNS